MASWAASSNVSLTSVAPYSPALILSRAVQNQAGNPWLPTTWVGRSGRGELMDSRGRVSETATAGEGALAQTERLRGDLEELVGPHPLQALLEVHDAGRRELHALFGR